MLLQDSKAINDVIAPAVNFDNDDENIDVDALVLYMLLIEPYKRIYQQYSIQTMDYVLEHIDSDVAEMEKDMLSHIDHLEDVYDSANDKRLKDAKIVDENIDKVPKNHSNLKYLKSEYKQTVKNICQEFKGQVKSRIYYLKDKNSDIGFYVNSYINRAVNRIKKLADYDVTRAKRRGENNADIFLYGDTLVNWVTAGDDNVCADCLAFERNNPHLLSNAPEPPLHPHCRCHLEKVDSSELTDEAKKLKYYNI